MGRSDATAVDSHEETFQRIVCVLRRPERRFIVHHLAATGDPISVPQLADEIVARFATDRRTVRTRLFHSDLPKLAGWDVVERRDGEVAPGEHCEPIARTLDAVEEVVH